MDRRHPFVLVDDLAHPVLAEGDHHHLARVRRLRDGDPLTVGDGRGAWVPARFGARCEPVGDVVVEARPAPALTVAFALTKGDRPEAAVQALTEVGVDRIVPFVADRTVVRWEPAKAARNAERLRVVAREAAMQAHRPWLPEVGEVVPFDLVADGTGVALAHPDGGALDAAVTTLLIGPEGGWSEREETAVAGRVGMAPFVLRAATAATVAGALLVDARRRVGTDTERG